MKAKRYIVIDIGTNSIKYCVTEVIAAATIKIVAEGVENVRLGEGMHINGNLTLDAMDRNIYALKKILCTFQMDNTTKIFAAGTMALRSANNAKDFLQKIKKSLGLNIEILSGKREAELSYSAIRSDFNTLEGDMVIFDVGGGSTELICAKEHDSVIIKSVNAGAVQYTEKWLISDPVSERECDQVTQSVRHELESFKFPKNLSALIGIGGAVTTLGAIKEKLREYDPHVIHGSTIEQAELERIIASLKVKSINERKKIIGLQPERADVILAGAIIIKEILLKSGLTQMIISVRGLRHGILLNQFSNFSLSKS